METRRELRINSQSLTDGQPAYTAPTKKQKLESKKGTWTALGHAILDTQNSETKNLVSKFFMAYMHESVHICHVDVRFFMQLSIPNSYPGNFVFE